MHISFEEMYWLRRKGSGFGDHTRARGSCQIWGSMSKPENTLNLGKHIGSWEQKCGVLMFQGENRKFLATADPVPRFLTKAPIPDGHLFTPWELGVSYTAPHHPIGAWGSVYINLLPYGTLGTRYRHSLSCGLRASCSPMTPGRLCALTSK